MSNIEQGMSNDEHPAQPAGFRSKFIIHHSTFDIAWRFFLFGSR